MEYTADAIDRKIIRLLQRDARMPIKEIAKKVFLSPPAVSARMERLEKAGVIVGYHAEINPQMFGYSIRAFVTLEIDPKEKQEFYPLIRSIPNVVECSRVTGEYSVLIEVMFRTTGELDHFINQLQEFGRTKTLIVFSTAVEHRDVLVETEEK